jgi:hypothetical protein
MRLVTKWLLTSMGGGALLIAGFLAAPDSLLFLGEDEPHPVADKVVQAVFWPIAVCVYLSGPGVPIGPPEKHMHEATPLQVVAALIGIGLSWAFYSSIAFLIFWLWRRRRAASRTLSGA